MWMRQMNGIYRRNDLQSNFYDIGVYLLNISRIFPVCKITGSSSFTYETAKSGCNVWTEISYILIASNVYNTLYNSVSQPSDNGPGINYTGPRDVLLEFVILVF